MALAKFTRRLCALALAAALATGLAGCAIRAAGPSPGTVVFLIESTPVNLDPRIGTDAQSQYLDSLIFSSLVGLDAHMDIVPDLATSWETPDPLTYIFHLRRGVHFQNGQSLTSADVKYTFDSILSGAVKTPKLGSYSIIRQVDTPDPWTVVFHLRKPYASFLWDLARPAIGIVPRPAAPARAVNPAEHPIGTGPFRFVRLVPDEEVVLERNADYFGQPPKIDRVIFRIVPDETTRALELRKGSADIALNSLTPDTVNALAHTRTVRVSEQPGTNLAYIGYNCTDAILRHARVRQALAYATNRPEIIRYLLRGQARIAYSLLPPGNWAYDPSIPHYDFDPARANRVLDEAGFPRGPGGIRFHLTLKTTTEETSRQFGAVLQQQWRQVGVALDLRSLEFGTFYADITRGSFELYLLRWIGANNDPDFLYYVFDSRQIPPAGANRGRYDNPELDRLLDQARIEPGRQEQKKLYAEAQEIIARDQPYLTLWYLDNVAVHSDRVEDIQMGPAGGFDFLTSIFLSGSGGDSRGALGSAE
ncbi:MAG TPA: ABC transporter substrate-binding protein [Patescibacteria group bacterium]|nr:ABC transporter substrate-binding protein [Patescibacteria group bacterium]